LFLKKSRQPEAAKPPAGTDKDACSAADPGLVAAEATPPRILFTRHFNQINQTGVKLRQFGGGDTTRFSR
jgi:hypothetical protein